MTHRFSFFCVCLMALTVTAGCSNAKKQLGLERNPPDEFAVVKRAPLEMPPEYGLRPPTPGASRPQEQATTDMAREAILGSGTPQQSGLTKGEAALLTSANAISNPQIRATVDEEAANARDENEPVVKKLLNIGRDSQPPAKVVDPQAEAQRLQQNAAEGLPPTAGATPSAEQD